ncbi:DUF7146 domain-containing protein [Rhodobacter xanthinilyticus]|uniref:DUF7146 domain-containing protein n=1 Tax=Rhodobacter xanthinilyticus TaxID=1850250 RepID=UPI0009F3884C|nr:toprim domain-containing protein [Rhodobacter xanthinilyticus]
MKVRDAAELSRRLARDAEAVCRHYLPNGRRQGQYWTVGDARNTPGRSMFVRLKGPEAGPGAAGHWTDAATAEHGDLLDVIRESCGLTSFGDVVEEARRFLSLPLVELARPDTPMPARATMVSPDAAQRLIAMAQPIRGTPVETYLAGRGIAPVEDAGALRYHPRCYYRPDTGAPAQPRPAMIASVTDLQGRITGAHRTWLAPDGSGKAAVTTPRRAMGNLLGNAVRFGVADEVLAVGEGIETMLSLRAALPGMPMAAALSAGHLGALEIPRNLRRLYIARDADAAGDRAVATLTARALAAGIDVQVLSPRGGDFNDDLQATGLNQLRAALHPQLTPEDANKFGEG